MMHEVLLPTIFLNLHLFSAHATGTGAEVNVHIVQDEHPATLFLSNQFHRLLTVKVVKDIQPAEELLCSYGDKYWTEAVRYENGRLTRIARQHTTLARIYAPRHYMFVGAADSSTHNQPGKLLRKPRARGEDTGDAEPLPDERQLMETPQAQPVVEEVLDPSQAPKVYSHTLTDSSVY